MYNLKTKQDQLEASSRVTYMHAAAEVRIKERILFVQQILLVCFINCFNLCFTPYFKISTSLCYSFSTHCSYFILFPTVEHWSG